MIDPEDDGPPLTRDDTVYPGDWPHDAVVRQRFFLGALALSVLAVAWLFSPFVYVILFAGTSAVVAQPVFARVHRVLKSRTVAAAVTTASIVLACVLPVAVMAAIGANELATFTTEFETWEANGGLDHLMDGSAWDLLPKPVENIVPDTLDLPSFTLSSAAPVITDVAGRMVNTGLDLGIYLMLVFAFLAEGPRILRVALNLFPMKQRYSARLYLVFEELSNNMVLGSLATAVVQGVVGAFGFWLCGVPHVALLGFGIALSSFVPAVGTLAVWLPVTLVVGLVDDWRIAIALAAWHIVVTGSIDNLLRPMMVRGRTEIHPVLIFLSIFGGMAWMGLAGLLVGPIIVAFFLSLNTMYCEDYLGLPTPLQGAPRDRPAARLLRRLRASDPHSVRPAEPRRVEPPTQGL